MKTIRAVVIKPDNSTIIVELPINRRTGLPVIAKYIDDYIDAIYGPYWIGFVNKNRKGPINEVATNFCQGITSEVRGTMVLCGFADRDGICTDLSQDVVDNILNHRIINHA